MKRKIAVVTGTRAEYGLLYWIMKEIDRSPSLQLQLIVTNMHLAPEHGYTYKLIENDGFKIERKIDMLVSGDTPTAISKSMGVGIIGFAQAYEELKPDILIVLGDRYELLAAVSAAIPFNITVAHIHGGEVTEGAIDEQIRHAITKMSHIHFASTQIYADNIVKMGENKDFVFNVGAPGLEWLKYNDYLSREALSKELNVDFNRAVALATFHPVTLEQDKTEEYITNLLDVLINSGIQVIITGANSDMSGAIINKKAKEAAKKYENIHFFDNLGQKRFHSCMKYCTFMIGNSSSGIIESASFGIPVVNIGTRQNGRLRSENIIDVGYLKDEIQKGIATASNINFREKVHSVSNIYGDSNVADKIVSIIKNIDISKALIKRLHYE